MDIANNEEKYLNINISPKKIMFSKSYISQKFESGDLLEDTIKKIATNEIKATDLPRIKVVKSGDDYISLDNRRLYVYRVLCCMGMLDTVMVDVVKCCTEDEAAILPKDFSCHVSVLSNDAFPHCDCNFNRIPACSAQTDGSEDSDAFVDANEAVSKMGTNEAVSKISTNEAVSKISTNEAVSNIGTNEAVSSIGPDDAVSNIGTNEAVSSIGTNEAVSNIGTNEVNKCCCAPLCFDTCQVQSTANPTTCEYVERNEEKNTQWLCQLIGRLSESHIDDENQRRISGRCAAIGVAVMSGVDATDLISDDSNEDLMARLV